MLFSCVTQLQVSDSHIFVLKQSVLYVCEINEPQLLLSFNSFLPFSEFRTWKQYASVSLYGSSYKKINFNKSLAPLRCKIGDRLYKPRNGGSLMGVGLEAVGELIPPAF